MLKVCYVPYTSLGLPRVSFFFSFLFFFFAAAAINSTNETNKAGGTRVKQSLFLDVYDTNYVCLFG